MAVAGESVGGDMAAALSIMAKQRGDVRFVQTSMYYPVTDAAMDTASYDEFAEGYYVESGWHQHPGEESGTSSQGPWRWRFRDSPRSPCTPASDS